MGLRIAMNTFEPALDIIKDKGFLISCDISKENDNYNEWVAIKDDFEISATNPVELLGLVLIYENFGEDWLKKQYSSNYMDYIDSKYDSKGFIEHMLRRR